MTLRRMLDTVRGRFSCTNREGDFLSIKDILPSRSASGILPESIASFTNPVSKSRLVGLARRSIDEVTPSVPGDLFILKLEITSLTWETVAGVHIQSLNSLGSLPLFSHFLPG